MSAARRIVVTLPPRQRVIELAAPADVWMTQQEVASHARVNRSTISQWTNRSDDPLPSHCPAPQTVLYRRSEVDAWLLRQPGRSAA